MGKRGEALAKYHREVRERRRMEREELERIRESVVTKIMTELHEVVTAVLEKAKGGDIAAARLLFELVGMTGRSVNIQQQQQTVINLSPMEREQLMKDLIDVVDIRHEEE